jgi:hypothetical protein
MSSKYVVKSSMPVKLKTDCSDNGKQAWDFSKWEANNHIDERLIVNEDGSDFTVTTLNNKRGAISTWEKFKLER